MTNFHDVPSNHQTKASEPWWEADPKIHLSEGNRDYPHRHFLLSAAESEICHLLFEEMRSRFYKSSGSTLVAIIDDIHLTYLGPEPLTSRQLICFLTACRQSAKRLLRTIAQMQMTEEHTESSASDTKLTAHHRSTVFIKQDGDESNIAEFEEANLANLTLRAASTHPARTLTLLGLLDERSQHDPLTAEWFEFVELTGSTFQEISRYFSVSVETVERKVRLFASNLML